MKAPLEGAPIDVEQYRLISAVAEVVVAPALEGTAAAAPVATAAIAAIFPGFSYGYTDRSAVNGSTVQFLDGFLCCLVIGHFNKGKSAGPAGEFVHNDLSRRDLAVFCKIIL
jgi:hypothetical protein